MAGVEGRGGRQEGGRWGGGAGESVLGCFYLMIPLSPLDLSTEHRSLPTPFFLLPLFSPCPVSLGAAQTEESID